MKLNYRKKSLKLLLALSLGLCVAHTGYAAPSGGSVVSGYADINGSNITNLAGTNIIDWQQFGIANGETVNFTGNGPWAVLNRVTGPDVSNILGTLNGQGGTVFLVNPNGIVFGNGASINTASFVASTLDISNDSFQSLMNGGTGSFSAGTGAGKIEFADAPNLNNTNSIFMGKSIEIDPGVNLTLNNSAAFLAGPNIDLINTPNNGNSDITSMRITNASADNSININGNIDSTAGSLSILGGKVDINGKVSSEGDMFIAAGKEYRFRKDSGQYGFSFTNRHTSAGNTVTIADGAKLTTNGNVTILANSVTNKGTLQVSSKLEIYALNDMMSDYDANGNFKAGYITSTAGNKFTNTGTIEAGKMEVLAGSIDNSGTLKATDGNTLLIAANNLTTLPDGSSYKISDTTGANLIKSTGIIESKSYLAILGGKVELSSAVTNSSATAGNTFIAAGKEYRFRKDAGGGNYGFSFTNRHTGTGNTVTIADGAKLTTNGNVTILANSATNNGELAIGKDLEIYVLNGMTAEYDANDNFKVGHINSTAENKFTNIGTIEAQKIEVLAGSIDNSGSLKTNTGDIFLTSANNITIVPNQAYNGMDKYQVNNATDTNLIKSTGTIESNGILTMLGGKVDINGNVSSKGDMFIAAGKTYSLVKDEGDFWFGYDKMSTSAGNTVTIAQGATVSSNNETGILANSVTNNGTITVDDQNGLAMYVVEDMQTTFDTSGKPVSANIVTSKNNKFTNNGTVTIATGGRFDIMANALDNKGAITTTRGDVVLTGNLSGNAIANIKSQVADDKYTGILMTGDSNGEPVYSFINPVQIPEVEKGSDLESAINQAMDILAQQGATPEVKAQATLDIIKGHATAGIEGSKEITKATPILTTVNESSPANNLSPTDNNTASNLTIENQEVE